MSDLPEIRHIVGEWIARAEELGRVSAGTDLGLKVAELDRVNRYGVEARYPGDWEPITRADAEEAVKIARATRDAVRAHIGKPE
jgi:HEPN domain